MNGGLSLKVYKPPHVAEVLGISERRLRRVAREWGCAHQLGRTMFFTDEDIAELRAHLQPKKDKVKAVALLAEVEAERSRLFGRQWMTQTYQGFVYFLECEGRIKIGFAKNVENRIRALTTSAPRPIRLLATMEGTRDDERKLHERFAIYRTHGEWFNPGDRLTEYIRDISQDAPK